MKWLYFLYSRFNLACSFFLSVTISFSPTTYTVTEGEDHVVTLILERGGDLTRTIVVSVLTGAGTAMGMQLPPIYLYHYIQVKSVGIQMKVLMAT